MPKGSLANPAGWLRKAIEQNYARPAGFVTQAEQEAQEQQRQARERQALDEQLRLAEDQMRQEEAARRCRAAWVRKIRSQYGATEADQVQAEQIKGALKAIQYEPQLLPAMEVIKSTKQALLIAVTDAESYRRATRSERSKIPIQRVVGQITKQTLPVEFVLVEEEPTPTPPVQAVVEAREGVAVTLGASGAKWPTPRHWLHAWGQQQALQRH